MSVRKDRATVYPHGAVRGPSASADCVPEGLGREHPKAAVAEVFVGSGEMGTLCRAQDWAVTPLGPIVGWPQSLRTVAGLTVASPFPMLVLWGPELVQIYNDGYRALMGAKHPAGLGKPTRECWPEVWDFHAPIYERVRRGESVSVADQRFVIERHGHAEEAFFTLFHSPVLDESASVGGVLVTAVETSSAVHAREVEAEHARLLEQAQAARADAEEANRTKMEFLASMSHELRTPLNAILGYAALLSDGITGPVTAAQLEQRGRVQASAQHLLMLIEEILSFARLEAGNETVRLAPADAGELAREAARLLEPALETHGLRFIVRTPDGPAPFVTDARKIRQILLNLLANAARFTPAGGEVGLMVRVEVASIIFTVRDTGIGIAPEHHERIFEPFWQVDQKTTRRAGGTGLGLSISRRFARLLGGDIIMTSVPGRGSTFTVRFPLDGSRPDMSAGDGRAEDAHSRPGATTGGSPA